MVKTKVKDYSSNEDVVLVPERILVKYSVYKESVFEANNIPGHLSTQLQSTCEDLIQYESSVNQTSAPDVSTKEGVQHVYLEEIVDQVRLED